VKTGAGYDGNRKGLAKNGRGTITRDDHGRLGGQDRRIKLCQGHKETKIGSGQDSRRVVCCSSGQTRLERGHRLQMSAHLQ